MSTAEVHDDTDSLVTFDTGWTLVGTVSPWSNEFNATAHRADRIGATGLFYSPYSGVTKVTIVGTLESPGVYGYPNVTYTLNGDTETPDLSTWSQPVHVNATGVTPGVILYTSPPVESGEITLTWRVNGASSTFPRFYIDVVYMESAMDVSNPHVYTKILYANGDIQYITNDDNRYPYYLMGGDRDTKEVTSQRFEYGFKGTGISVYATIFPNQYPPIQVDIQIDDRKTKITLPTTSREINAAVIYSIDGLRETWHMISVTTQSSSVWAFDYFLVQKDNLTSPKFVYAVSNGNLTSSPGSETGTLVVDSESTAAPQSVFISYALTDGNVVPTMTYTTLIPEATETTRGPVVTRGVVVGATLGGIATVVLFASLIWLLYRRRKAILLQMAPNEWQTIDPMVARPFTLPQDRTINRRRKPYVERVEEGDDTTLNPPRILEKTHLRQRREPIPSPSISPPLDTGAPISLEDPLIGEAVIRPSSQPPVRAREELDTGIRPRSALGVEEAPQQERQRRGRIIQESDAGISLEADKNMDIDTENIEILPPAYEHHRRRALN